MMRLVFLIVVGSCLVMTQGTEFWVRRPKAEALDTFLGRYSSAKPNAPEVARSTLPTDERFPKHFERRKLKRSLLPGSSYAKAERAVLDWGSRAGEGSSFVYKKKDPNMATCARTYLPFIWVVNPVLETYRIQNKDCAAVAYTTIGTHLLAGEERLMVSRDQSSVVVEILSVCRGQGPLGRLVFPLIGPMQNRFFQAQLDFVQQQALLP